MLLGWGADADNEQLSDAAGALAGGLGRDQLHNPGAARSALLDGRLGPQGRVLGLDEREDSAIAADLVSRACLRATRKLGDSAGVEPH